MMLAACLGGLIDFWSKKSGDQASYAAMPALELVVVELRISAWPVQLCSVARLGNAFYAKPRACEVVFTVGK